MEYKISATNERKYFFKPLFIILSIDIFFVLFSLYKIENFDYYNLGVVVCVIIGFSLIYYLMPLLVLFFNYKKFNNEQVFNFKENRIEVESITANKLYYLKDLKYIMKHLSVSGFKIVPRWFFWDALFYYELIFEKNETIYVTCLVLDDLEKHFVGKKIVRIKRFIPIIKKHSHLRPSNH